MEKQKEYTQKEKLNIIINGLFAQSDQLKLIIELCTKNDEHLRKSVLALEAKNEAQRKSLEAELDYKQQIPELEPYDPKN